MAFFYYCRAQDEKIISPILEKMEKHELGCTTYALPTVNYLVFIRKDCQSGKVRVTELMLHYKL